MMKKKCPICASHGKINQETVENHIYDLKKNHSVFLCYSHSIELFKTGQTRFLGKYSDQMSHFTFEEKGRRQNHFEFR